MNRDELHLKNAPIVEALISIDVGSSLSNEAMLRVEKEAAAFQDDYPQSEPFQFFQLQVDMNAGQTPQSTAQHDTSFGKKYVSSDKRQLVVLRRNGFSFSRLPPYQTWADFRAEAQRLWTVYRTASGPLPIVRFGLRYINRISVPIGKPVEEFLRLYPEIPSNPDGSLRTVNSYYMRVDSMLDEIPSGHLIIQQAVLPPGGQNLVTLSLDFDISVMTPQGATEEYVWETLDSARHVKNQLFIDSLTPEFLETFR
jgi:uncharacterized protein (TIGR04255 family)